MCFFFRPISFLDSWHSRKLVLVGYSVVWPTNPECVFYICWTSIFLFSPSCFIYLNRIVSLSHGIMFYTTSGVSCDQFIPSKHYFSEVVRSWLVYPFSSCNTMVPYWIPVSRHLFLQLINLIVEMLFWILYQHRPEIAKTNFVLSKAPRPLPQSWSSPPPHSTHYNGTQQWHHVHSSKVGRHPPPNHRTLQWHPAMAPSNGTTSTQPKPSPQP